MMHIENFINFPDILDILISIHYTIEMYASVTVPAFEFKCNLVVFPLPEGIANVSSFKKYITTI